MTARSTAATAGDDTRSVLRQLKLLVTVLIMSNIALGAFGVFILRGIDRKYSALIDQSVPTLQALQSLTVGASTAMRSTNPGLLGDSKTTPAGVAGRARVAIEQESELRNRTLERDWIRSAHQERANIRESGEAFEHSAAQVIPLLEANKSAEADKLRESVMRPAYDRYVTATTDASERLRSASLQTSDSISLHTGKVSKVMIGLASWPIMILATFLLFTAVFVIAVVIKVMLFKEEAV